MTNKHIIVRFFASVGGFLATGLLVCTVIAISAYVYFSQQLPDVDVLKAIQLQVPLRIETKDGKLIAEYGQKRRIPIPYEKIPAQLVNAILATEDQRYFEHSGVDPIGLFRAAVTLIRTGVKEQGGSTITMQVARNFFLSRKKTYSRKLKEILLAIKINRELSKQKILELYMNKIYFGNRAYGVGAAAQVYYGKALGQLSLAQYAMIAGLPKAPSSINPIANPSAALKRRNHVLERMHTENYITSNAYQQAIAMPLSASYHTPKIEVHAPYVAEMIRTDLLAHYGKAIYTKGLTVYTTVNSTLQNYANHAVWDNLIQYSQRHGYRGPIDHFDSNNQQQWQMRLKKMSDIHGLIPAVVSQLDDQSVSVITEEKNIININWQGLAWARARLADNKLGPKPKTAADILKVGDLIRIYRQKTGQWQLAQLPKVEGALVAINPNNGAILAVVGGFNFQRSKFNRVTQALRQSGSNFKPFIYSAALAHGFTLATQINDAPVIMPETGVENVWRPQNDSRNFYGPTRLRTGLIKSRNLVSIRILQALGIPFARQHIKKFGFDMEKIPNALSLALGSGTVTPLELATAYSVLANGGFKVNAFIIDKVDNSLGQTIYVAEPYYACQNCATEQFSTNGPIPNLAPRVISAQNAFLITSALQDVIRHGTGRRARILGRHDLSGKTGTTNEQVDAWFSGYNRDLVVTTWVGFDQPKSLYEYGAQAALPMWIEFMQKALKGVPEKNLPQPSGIVSVRINKNTGQLANSNDKNSIFEFFRMQFVPKKSTLSNNNKIDNDISNSEEQLF